MGDDAKFLGGLGVGVGLGAVGYALLSTKFLAEDDRPPIIVRGGSLIFQNGVGNIDGKPWEKRTSRKDWQMKHGAGKPTAGFLVIIPGGSGNCGPAYVESLSFDYELGKGSTTFELVTRGEGITGKPAPTIIGDRWNDLKPGTYGNGYTLTFDEAGTLQRVRSGMVIDCASPGTVYIVPLPKGF